MVSVSLLGMSAKLRREGAERGQVIELSFVPNSQFRMGVSAITLFMIWLQ